jgi:hypothetical protein
MRRDRADAIMTLSTTRSRAPDDARVALDSMKTDAEKFFWITSLNRVVDDPTVIGIARIGRKAIRMRIASRDREDDRRGRNRRPTRSHDDDSMDDRAARTTRDVAPPG